MQKKFLVLMFVTVLANAQVVLTAKIHELSGSNVNGSIAIDVQHDKTLITGSVTGLTPGKHGFHIHEFGDCGGVNASNSGPHYNPVVKDHGVPSIDSHFGDLGNIVANAEGIAPINIVNNVIKIEDANKIKGRSIIIHAGVDDFVSQPSGDSGAKIACGIIE